MISLPMLKERKHVSEVYGTLLYRIRLVTVFVSTDWDYCVCGARFAYSAARDQVSARSYTLYDSYRTTAPRTK